MVAYNFKEQFAPLVSSGIKRQTIRANGDRRHAAPGESVQLYTGQRTKECRKLVEPDPVCVRSRPIGISANHDVFLGVGSDIEQLDETAIAILAATDGFKSTDEFFQFF